ncbi:MAG: glycosyl transferase family 1 [Flavobacteriaceae bacterium]
MMTEPKKVLIVTYYWPPAGGPGVQRWLKFANYLPEFGISPVVYVPKDPNYPILDKQLMAEVSPEVQVIRRKIVEPTRWLRKLSPGRTQSLSRGMVNTKNPGLIERLMMWVRGHVFIPDPRVFWVRPSVDYLKKYLSKHPQIDTVITTGPPHSVHLIGHQLQQSTAIKWVADFRDPWTEIYYHKSMNLTPWAQKKHLKLERIVLESADLILATSATTAASFSARTKRPVALITNGFDKSDFKHLSNGTPNETSNKFRITHVGTLMEARNPRALWLALESLLAQTEMAETLEIVLVGPVAQGVLDDLRELGLDKYLVLEPYMAHEQAISVMAQAELLVLAVRDESNAHHIVPGKIFEYLTLEAPIIAIGPPKSAVASMLNDTQAGALFDHGDHIGVNAFISQVYANFKRSESKTPRLNTSQFERRALTAKLAEIIKNIPQ